MNQGIVLIVLIAIGVTFGLLYIAARLNQESDQIDRIIKTASGSSFK